MSMITCEHCGTHVMITSAGVCPSCRKTVSAAVIPAEPIALPAVRRDVVDTAPIEHPAVGAQSDCDFCGRASADARTAFVNIFKITYRLVFPNARRLSVECMACDSCVAASKKYQRRRDLAVAGIVLLVFLGAMTLIYMGLFGDPGTEPNKLALVAVTGVVLSVIVWAMRAHIRHPRGVIPALLGPRMNVRFLRLLGINEWGPSWVVIDRRAGNQVVGSIADLPDAEPA